MKIQDTLSERMDYLKKRMGDEHFHPLDYPMTGGLFAVTGRRLFPAGPVVSQRLLTLELDGSSRGPGRPVVPIP